MKRTCKQCGREFELSESQIAWYQEKGLQLPKRCEECRAENKAKKSGDGEDRQGADAATPPSSNAGTRSGNAQAPKRLSAKIAGAIAAVAVAVAVGLGSGTVGSDGAGTAAPSDTNTTPAITATASDANATTYKFRSNKYLKEHFEKHGKHMGYQSKEAYVAGANAVISDPEALHKTEKEDGDDVYYLEATDEIVIVSTDGYIRTYFNPGGIDYFNRQ